MQVDNFLEPIQNAIEDVVNEGSGNGDMVMEATNEVDDMGEDKMEESVKEIGFSLISCQLSHSYSALSIVGF